MGYRWYDFSPRAHIYLTNIVFSDPRWPSLRKTLPIFQSLPHHSLDLASV